MRRTLAIGAALLLLPACESASLAIEPGEVIDFGEVRAGDTAERQVRILNTGTGGVTINKLERVSGDPIRITGVDSAPSPAFAIWFESKVIPPGEFMRLQAQYFGPNAEASRQDSVTLEVSGRDIANEDRSVQFTLSVQLLVEDCGPAPQLDFGDVPAGTRVGQAIEIRNDSTLPSRSYVGYPQSTSDAHLAFALNPATPAGTSQQDPGVTRPLIVWFEPQQAGEYVATLPIRPGSGCRMWNVPLTGKGV